MKVKELIKLLSQFDGDMPVEFDDRGIYRDVGELLMASDTNGECVLIQYGSWDPKGYTINYSKRFGYEMVLNERINSIILLMCDVDYNALRSALRDLDCELTDECITLYSMCEDAKETIGANAERNFSDNIYRKAQEIMDTIKDHINNAVPGSVTKEDIKYINGLDSWSHPGKDEDPEPEEEEFHRRSMTEDEDKYSFSQSSQISSQCGLIGYLRADMDTDGNGFFNSWNDYRKDLKTQEFKDEFDRLINSMREEGDILYNRKALKKFCNATPQARMNTDQEYYGVRVDSKQYTYLFRLNPNKEEYNVYVYCYKQQWLDDHIKQARRGIRFIDTDYNVLFKIPDGDQICIKIGKDAEYRKCRYIDEYHFEFGDTIYHICEFAEKIKGIGAKVVPYRYDLPNICYAVHNESGKMIIIRKGETGYYDPGITTKDSEESRNMADEYNAIRGISKAQAAAMYWGSLFGFETPGADPKSYDRNGNLIRKGEC